MSRTIVDLTKPDGKSTRVPITLKLCLQDSESFHFTKGEHDNFLCKARKITRLATMDDYSTFKDSESDLILVDGCLFLGQWNDGVVE